MGAVKHDNAAASELTSVYEDRYCLFIDVMGFAEKIRRSEGDIYLQHSINGALARIENFFLSGPYSARGDARVSIFSDSIALSLAASPVRDVRTEDLGIFMLRDAVLLAVDLVSMGFLVRGGFARGELFHKNLRVFGPALVKAYELEQTAIFPRIVTDRETLGRMADPRHGTAAFMATMLQHEPSGLLYLNYINIGGACARWRNLTVDRICEFMQALYRLICSEVGSTKISLSTKHKMDWMAHEYNRSIKEMLDSNPRQFSDGEKAQICALPLFALERRPYG
ncbi:MAG: hypothetical protein ACR2GP_15395 [Burkholderiaceae bacterium]